MRANRYIAMVVISSALIAICIAPCRAQGLFGGGGGLFGGGGGGGGLLGGGGFGGGGRLLGGGPIAAPAPAFGGGGGLLGGGRPSIGGGAPLLRGPSISPPIADRPILGGGPNVGGLPADDRPIFGGGGDRPIISPPNAGSLPGPDRPILGGGPSARPLPGGDRPILGDRTGIAGGPSAGILPDVGPPRPGPIPAINLPGNVRPSQRVTADHLDDFLNKPSIGTNDAPLPKSIDRPGGLDGGGPIASQLPDRPILDDGPGLADRPILGERPVFLPDFGETILEDRIREEIAAHRIERAVRVRDRVHELYYRANHPYCYWWHYMWTKHPVWSWWRVTAPLRWCNWQRCTAYYGWSGTYAQPVQYEYTSQGVYADSREVKTNDQYSEQALELARTGAAALQAAVDENRTDKLEWLPLGAFSLNDSEDGDPSLFLQIAVSKEAIVAGTYFNAQTSEYLQLVGGLDKETQRVAMIIGDKEDVVVETGMYNLTQEQSSALLHFEDGTIQNWILVRMPDPQGKQDGAE